MSCFNLKNIWLNFFFFIILSLTNAEAGNMKKEEPGCSRAFQLFDENLKPKAELVNLLNILGKKDKDNSIKKINEWSQQNLLRVGERWDVQTNKFDKLKDEIMPLLKNLGFVNEVCPHFQEYKGAIVHGAALPVVLRRFRYLVELWKKGVCFSDIYFLSGNRDLTEKEKNILKSEGHCEDIATEAEMVKYVWQAENIPEATTWFGMHPPKGRYLAVSNAPYINRQDLVMRANKNYDFDTVGPQAPEMEAVAIFLDEVARCVFQTMQFYHPNEG